MCQGLFSELHLWAQVLSFSSQLQFHHICYLLYYRPKLFFQILWQLSYQGGSFLILEERKVRGVMRLWHWGASPGSSGTCCGCSQCSYRSGDLGFLWTSRLLSMARVTVLTLTTAETALWWHHGRMWSCSPSTPWAVAASCSYYLWVMFLQLFEYICS